MLKIKEYVKAESLEQAFELCPWNEDLQRYIFRNYPENRRDILRASTDFGIGIYDCVEELLRKEYTDEDRKSEERALQAKSRILKIMADLNVPQTCVLDELEVDCLHRLCPDLQNADEVTCNNYIEAIQAYDAQEQNKQIVINEINARLDEIWSVEDDAACKALYLNTDIRIPEQVQRAIERIKEKSRTKAHEPYVKALQECSEKEINSARSYRKGIAPKIYATLAWAGLLLAINNTVWLHASMGVSVCGIVLSCILGILYLLLEGAWTTLTINKTVIHTALTENNPPTKMKVPAFVLSIPVAAAFIAVVYFSHTWQNEGARTIDAAHAAAETQASETMEDMSDADSGTDDSGTGADTVGHITAPYIYDYLGYWTVDRYNSYLDGYVGFNLESNNDILCFSAQAVWNQGDRVTTIGTVSLDMNYDGTQAGGYYQDDRGNDGNIVLDFENGELYLTVTCRSGGDWAMTMEHEHCTLDPNGVQEEYADPDLPSYSESGYDYYSDGQTVSRGINDVSSDYIGSNHLWPTDTLTITNSDLSVLTRTEVAEIRNEIFARHGYVFSSSQWSDYFSTADWYYPDSSFSNDMLSSTEKQNVDTITAYEKAQGWNQ